jgi:hypothetical protein
MSTVLGCWMSLFEAKCNACIVAMVHTQFGKVRKFIFLLPNLEKFGILLYTCSSDKVLNSGLILFYCFPNKTVLYAAALVAFYLPPGGYI